MNRLLSVKNLLLFSIIALLIGCQSTNPLNRDESRKVIEVKEIQSYRGKNIINKMQEAQFAYDKSQWTLANQKYLVLSQLMPEDAYTFFRLGNIALRLNETNDAILYFRKSLQLNPRFIEAKNNLAITYLLLAEQEFNEMNGLLEQNQHTADEAKIIAQKRNIIKNILKSPFYEKTSIE